MRQLHPTLGRRIRYLRRHHDLLQKDVAMALGVKTQTVGAWERDLQRVPSAVLPQLVTVFGLASIDTLFAPEFGCLLQPECTLITH